MFIPYAAHDHDAYALKVKTAFSKWGNYLSLPVIHLECCKIEKKTHDNKVSVWRVFIHSKTKWLLLEKHKRFSWVEATLLCC